MQVEEAETYKNQLKNHLKQAKETLPQKNLDPALLANYAIKAYRALAPWSSCLLVFASL